MSLKPRSFPYPVLSYASDDYLDAVFDSTIEVKLSNESVGSSVSFDFNVELTSPYLLSQVTTGVASIFFDIEAPEVLFRKAYETGLSGSLSFDSGKLLGKIQVTPYVLAKEPVADFSPTGVHHEFSGSKFTLRRGDVMAIGPSQEFDLVRDQVANPAFMVIQLSPEQHKDTYQVLVSASPIVVLAGENVMKYWSLSRDDRAYKPSLFQSMYKDCILYALEALQDGQVGDDIYWARALMSKVNQLGFANLDGLDSQVLNEIALRLTAPDGLAKTLRILEGAA